MLQQTKALAIVGGGRWGQLLLSILATMRIPFSEIIMVSRANAEEVKAKVAELELISLTPLKVVATIDDLFAQHTIAAAIVVNSARQHFETAHRLIKNKVHVLIEKPIVLSLEQMKNLIEEAKHQNICLVPGLSYRFCSYIQNFATEVRKKGIPKKFCLRWSDANSETRYGQVKKFDQSINIIQDVMSHIWTILSGLFQHPTINILSCSQTMDKAALNISINGIEGQLLLERNALNRERHLLVQFDTNQLILDFTREPGIIKTSSEEYSADPLWSQKCTPLTQQLMYFFSLLPSGQSTVEDLNYCLHSVSCTEQASSSV